VPGKQDQLVIALTGMPASGKDAALELVRGKVPIFRMGDVVIEHLHEQGAEVTAESVGAMANQLRAKHGKGAIALLLGERLTRSSEPVVIINGVRGIAEVREFRRTFPLFTLIAVHCAPDTRYSRVQARQREDDAISREAFDAKDARELSWGLGEAIATADRMIVNEGSHEELHGRFREVLNALGVPFD